MSNVVDVLIKAIRLNAGGIRDEIRKCLIPLAKWSEIPLGAIVCEPGEETEALQRIAETARNMHQTFRAKLIAAGITEAEIDAPLEEEEE